MKTTFDEKRIKMEPVMIRMKPSHRIMLKKLAAKKGMGEAELVRDFIEKMFLKEL